MRRFSLLLVILGSIVLAALLARYVLGTGSFGGRSAASAAAEPPHVIPVAAFRHVDVSGNAEVTLVQGSTPSVSIGVQGRRGAHTAAEVRGDTLYIEASDRTRWWNFLLGGRSGRNAPVVVTFKDLESVSAAGSVSLTADQVHVPQLRISGAGGTSLRIDDLRTPMLKVAGAGALKAELAGRVTEQTVSIAGAGEYRGGKLMSDRATVTVSGAGRVVVNAATTLKVTISGAGSVEYLGDPQVTQQISGAGRVRKRDAAAPGASRVATASVHRGLR